MFSLVLILTLALQLPETKPQSSPTPSDAKGDASAKPKAESEPETPEQALRTFFIAMAIKDVETLRSVTLATKDFDWLLKGDVVPPEHVEEFKKFAKEQPIRSLKPGEEFTLPRNRKVTVRQDEVGPDRAVLLPENAPVPNRMRKIDGKWRVDATPIIAGRKAAEAARKKAQSSSR